MCFGAPPMLVNIFNMQNWADDRMISGMWRWRFVPEERARLWGQQGPFGCPSPGLAPGAGAGAGRLQEEARMAAGDAPLLPSACPQPAKRLHFWFWLAVPGCLLQRQLLYCLSLLFGRQKEVKASCGVPWAHGAQCWRGNTGRSRAAPRSDNYLVHKEEGLMKCLCLCLYLFFQMSKM